MIPWIPILFISLAGMFKAVADTLTHHFDTSVFKNRERKWWDPVISWKYAKVLPWTKYKVDAWHVANSLQIICWCAAMAGMTYILHRASFPWWAIFIGSGLLFNISFNLFYNKIFR
jgi:hypothetical protein